jgi:gliding motility-associated peptidyl-prolyl isomerase
MRESVERNKVLNKLEEGLIMKKMQSDSLHTYNASPNGFWYFYEEKDTMNTANPVKGDEVIFAYEIKDLRDSIIYSKEELGDKHYLVDREDLISGLQDGIKLMKEGEVVTFLFPSYKAYGYSGYEKINSNQPLIYSVHLKKIISK